MKGDEIHADIQNRRNVYNHLHHNNRFNDK